MTNNQVPVTDLVVASSAQDAEAVQAVRQHHAELAGTRTARVEALPATAAAGEPVQDSDGHDTGRCGCSESDGTPELDVRAIPHAIRHATVFGAFDAILPGGSMVLIAPHDPQPLLRQLVVRTDGRLDIDYLERGPEAWRLQLTRL